MKKSKSKGFSKFAEKSSNIAIAFRILDRFSDYPVYDTESLANSLGLAQSTIVRIASSMHLPRKTAFIRKKKRVLLFLTEEYMYEVLIPEIRSVLYKDKIELSYEKMSRIERLFPLDCYMQSYSKSSLYSNSYFVSHDFNVSQIAETLDGYNLLDTSHHFSLLSIKISGDRGNVAPDILVKDIKKGEYLPIALEIVHSLRIARYFPELFRRYYKIHSIGNLFALHIILDEDCFSDVDDYINHLIDITKEEALSGVPTTVIRKENIIVVATDHLHIYLWKLGDALQSSNFSYTVLSQVSKFAKEGRFLVGNELYYVEQHISKIVIKSYWDVRLLKRPYFKSVTEQVPQYYDRYINKKGREVLTKKGILQNVYISQTLLVEK